MKTEFEDRVDEYYGESADLLNRINGNIRVEAIDEMFKSIVKNSDLLEKAVKSYHVNLILPENKFEEKMLALKELGNKIFQL